MNYIILKVFIVLIPWSALFIIHLKYIKVKKHCMYTQDINDTLFEISDELSKFKNQNELYEKMLQYTIKLIKGAQYGSIQVYNKAKDYMEFVALSGYDINQFTNPHLKREELFLYTLNKLTEPGIIINPLVLNKHLYNSYEKELIKNSCQLIYKSVLSAPLYIDGEFFGCINVDNIESASAFTKNDIEIIKYISVHLEIVIKNMLHVNDMKHGLITDSLTGLYNRRYYNNLVELSNDIKSFSDCLFIMIDIDNFKMINDKYGHSAGDEALKYFSGLLKSRFRRGDSIIRFAGDEFILILYNCAEKDAEALLDGIQKDLYSNPFHDIRISFSYGINKVHEDSDMQEIIDEADKKMYIQKKAKRAQYKEAEEPAITKLPE